jgi:hypothetical protein
MIKLPVFSESYKKQTLIQSSSILELSILVIAISILYFAFVYFIPIKEIAVKIKAMKEPIMKMQKEKFDYWLKSELYEQQLSHESHLEWMDGFEVRKAWNELNVMQKAAELNDMETDSFVKMLMAKANAAYTEATSEKEKTEAKLLMEAVPQMAKMSPMWQAFVISCITRGQHTLTEDLELKKELNEVVKDKQKQELRKAVIENDNLEEKYKRNKQPAE